MSHTLLVFHQVKLSTLMLLSKREVNGRLYIEEVGVDLEPCVHALGHDVQLNMEAAHKNSYPHVISSSCIHGSIIYDRGF